MWWYGACLAPPLQSPPRQVNKAYLSNRSMLITPVQVGGSRGGGLHGAESAEGASGPCLADAECMKAHGLAAHTAPQSWLRGSPSWT